MPLEQAVFIVIVLAVPLWAAFWQSPAALKWCASKMLARIDGIELQKKRFALYLNQFDAQ